MNKMAKRFMALVIVFASIISFLPIQIGSNGKAANAITTQIEVSGDPKEANDSITFVNGEYYTKQTYRSFTLGLDDKRVGQDEIPIGQTGVTKQEVIITNIDGIDLNGLTIDQKNDTLADINTKIKVESYFNENKNKKIGVIITGLPLGVNKIKYRIREETVFNAGKVTDPSKPTVKENSFNDPKVEYFPGENSESEIVIQHANNFVQNKIPYIDFVDYDNGRLPNPDPNPESNTTPFVYMQRSKVSNSLRFTHDLPNSITDMDYKISFPDGIVIGNSNSNTNDLVYVNGIKKDNVSIDTDSKGKPVLKGSLKELGSTMVLIAIRHSTVEGSAINYTYSVDIQYNGKDVTKDYTLRNSGIKKLYYDAESSVKAYIGKEFTTEVNANGTIEYTGKITIDNAAEMIGIAPTIGRDTSITALKISNHYGSSNTIEPSRIINGQTIPFVDFKKDPISNQIWLEIYEGKDGNIIAGKLPLAIYKLDVVTQGTEGTVNFSVDSSTSYLSQPGRTAPIDFDASRRTYDLHFNDENTTKATNTAKFTLTQPQTGREYMKVWGGTSSQSDNLTEITDSTHTLGDYDVDVDITNYKKIVVQAYYDKTINENDSSGNPLPPKITAYPLGEKYTFYIAKNPDTDTSTGTTKSSDATLSNMSSGKGTIKSTDGTSGFSSSKTDYTLTVPKTDTVASIIATATSSKVKDITATIAETGDQYGLTSGSSFDLPLNSSGKTNIKIVVTAEDGVATKTYNLTISNDTRSASSLLKDVITDKGDFTFDSEKDPNKIRVDQSVSTLKVSPVAEDAKSRITVNGTTYSGTPIIIDLKGSQKTDMSIKVTAEDGSASKTYYFEIYRTDSSIPSDEDDDTSDSFYDDIDNTWVDLSKYEEWGTVDGKTVYFNNKGRQVKNQWINTKGVWYFLDSKGYKASGWRKEVGGKTYYLDPNTGAIKTGWMKQNNKVYYLGLNGVMQKGWLSLNGHWYYFTPEGEMVVNQSMYIDDGTYRFGADGAIY